MAFLEQGQFSFGPVSAKFRACLVFPAENSSGTGLSDAVSNEITLPVKTIMSESDSPSRQCECSWAGRAVEGEVFPVTFDEKMGEFHLLTNPSGYAIMRFCPWCGIAFPKSKRGAFFSDPSLDVFIQENADGKLTFSFGGK